MLKLTISQPVKVGMVSLVNLSPSTNFVFASGVTKPDQITYTAHAYMLHAYTISSKNKLLK